jgi:Cu2+-exporting ATPase
MVVHHSSESEVDILLSKVENMSINDLITELENHQGSNQKKNHPLLWPTISLGIATVSNPIAIAINAPLMLWNSTHIFKRSYRVIKEEKRVNIDFLDTLAISASIGQGNMIAGGIIVWLICLGDMIRDMTAAGSKKAVEELLEFKDKNAWLIVDGVIIQVKADEIKIDDLIVVYPGEMIPVDGEIQSGHALVEQKTITGESLPVEKIKSDNVFAATIVKEGQITVKSQRVGKDTTAGQIAHLVDSAPIGDTRMQNHAEKFADKLVVPTLGLAVGSAAITLDYQRFLSLVIVDYGTGIRVAAPTAVLSSMTYAARNGVIIKSGAHMESMAAIDTVVFDKTGTLSYGTPHVVEIFTTGINKNTLLGFAVAAESNLTHPVADALREKSKELEIHIPQCDNIQYKIGLGVEGIVGTSYVHVGSERFLKSCDIDTSLMSLVRSNIDQLGYSSLYVALDGKLSGIISYEDMIRPECIEVIAALKEKGVTNLMMLTGDNEVVASAISKRLGLTSFVANMMPTDKADVILSLQKSGKKVMMVGDGINDSVALCYANVGVAMRYGSDITHESADVILMEDSLWKLVKAIEISQDAVKLIKQNYSIVAVLNTIALLLVLPGGIITPEITALISNGSAILSSGNGMRPLLRK